jgi:hypothetical protein
LWIPFVMPKHASTGSFLKLPFERLPYPAFPWLHMRLYMPAEHRS